MPQRYFGRNDRERTTVTTGPNSATDEDGSDFSGSEYLSENVYRELIGIDPPRVCLMSSKCTTLKGQTKSKLVYSFTFAPTHYFNKRHSFGPVRSVPSILTYICLWVIFPHPHTHPNTSSEGVAPRAIYSWCDQRVLG